MIIATLKDSNDTPAATNRIPVRNIWLLLLYASDLGRYVGRFDSEVEASPDLSTLIARLLAFTVERRLKRNLSRDYQQRDATLSRVKGRINILRTYREGLLFRGQVAVRFDDFTINTPRNRLVRAALNALRASVDDAHLNHRCRSLANTLGELGVSGLKPTRSEVSTDYIGRSDSDDRLMVTLAQIVFDLVLPTEASGGTALSDINRDRIVLWKLFQKAVGNFYENEFSADRYIKVRQGIFLKWPLQNRSSGSASILPSMQTDIIIENTKSARRLVIDTKFTSIFARSNYRQAVLKSGYIYQIYAYLRSQELEADEISIHSEGMLLHPTINVDVDEWIEVQGHRIRFVTLDLMKKSSEILARLRELPAYVQ